MPLDSLQKYDTSLQSFYVRDTPFNRYFNKTRMTHSYGTWCSTKKCVFFSKVNYGKESIKFSPTKNLQLTRNTSNFDLFKIWRAKAKKLMGKHFIETHMDSSSTPEINIIQISMSTINSRYVLYITLSFFLLTKTLFSLY